MQQIMRRFISKCLRTSALTVLMKKVRWFLERAVHFKEIRESDVIKAEVTSNLLPLIQVFLGPDDRFGNILYVWQTGLSRLAANLEGKQALSFYSTSRFFKSTALALDNNHLRPQILFVLGMFPNPKHGGGLRIYDMVVELSKNNDIWIYSSFQPDLDNDYLAEMKQHSKGLRIVPSHQFSPDDFEKWLIPRQKVFTAAYHVWPQSVPLMTISRSFARKVIFELIECSSRRDWLHARDVRTPSTMAPPNLPQSFVYSLVHEAAAANLADTVVALTQMDADFAKGVFKHKDVKIIPTGASQHSILTKLSGSRALPKDFPNEAVFIGYYGHYPNIEGLDWYFREIHAKIVERVPDYLLNVVGKGDVSSLQKKYSKLPGIRWVGEVDDIVPNILKAKLCICPLISGAGLRGKIIQYSISGKATVSTQIGVCGTPFVDMASVMVADQPIVFAERVVQLLTEPETLLRISAAAESVAKEHFSWDAIIPSLEKLFHET